MSARIELGVNIDHVATLRQVRYRDLLHLPNVEPDVLIAAHLAEEGGADQITVHLRQDRRHIQDRDVRILREHIKTRLNLEMGNTGEIIEIALELRPHSVCLVPEHRQEITTEGGLDVASAESVLRDTIRRCQDAGIRVSLFIDPETVQIEAAARLGVEMIELHTGGFAVASGRERQDAVLMLAAAARLAHQLGLQVNAGHGITTLNVVELFIVPHVVELNVGHHLVSRALETGLRAAVAELRAVVDRYPAIE
jgi:pyridoxine 5-phosphate synthase